VDQRLLDEHPCVRAGERLVGQPGVGPGRRGDHDQIGSVVGERQLEPLVAGRIHSADRGRRARIRVHGEGQADGRQLGEHRQVGLGDGPQPDQAHRHAAAVALGLIRRPHAIAP
jgi:hypothetical protein